MTDSKPLSDAKLRLVEAARSLFATHGFEGASIRDITSAAEANLAAVTYHFGTKEELYHEVLRRITGPLGERAALLADPSVAPLDRVAAALRAFFAHIRANPEMPALMVRELASGREIAPPIVEMMGQMLPRLAATIVEGQQRGEIRAGDPVLMALSAVAIPVYLNIARPLIARALGMDLRDDAHYARIVEHTVTTVRAQLVSTTP